MSTITFYESNANAYAESTVSIDMADLHRRFLSQVPLGGYILDAGCGSGRDSKAFLQQGFRLRAFDASATLAAYASQLTGQEVEVRQFQDVKEQCCYDGIWACASLLHVPEATLPGVLAQLWAALKPGGVMYMSFKLGQHERFSEGRHFTDATEERLRGWFADIEDVASGEFWISPDRKPGSSEQWLNALFRRHEPVPSKLVSGGTANPFLPHLCSAIHQADEIDIAVAFVKVTGLRLLLPDLSAALGPERGRPPARIRFLTSDYLDITDPDALSLLLLLREKGAQVRVFVTAGSSFHLKAYLFARHGQGEHPSGSAFIGSSNISRQALQSGLEWNYRIDYPEDSGFLEARSRFESLFAHPQVSALNPAWIDDYRARRVPPPRPIEAGSEEQEPLPEPTPPQREALAALAQTRSEGYRRGLVVMATGLGKTWLAAFDVRQVSARRVLFVAHREEILEQAAATFIRIRPTSRVGYYSGQAKDLHVDIVCASIQTLSRDTHLEKFSPEHFDYIVVDEFHHASAPSYRRLLRHFTPRFMLGLTATPERTDQSDILSLCDDNLVHSCNLFQGIDAGLLAPFHYYGIYDDTVDYDSIPWRNGRFDPELLSNKLATLARARHALRQWTEKGQSRTLSFCISIRHAEHMSEHFRKAGIAAAAVYAGSQKSRGEALAELRDGRLRVIFSVDLFNEGVDVPEIDTVMMLRPTESKILFLQQLGRGLRRADGKAKLVVLDFIGNHHSFLHKPQALLGIRANYRALATFARDVQANHVQLPDGCYINYDLALIDYLRSLEHDGLISQYEALKQGLGHRPTLTEFYRGGASLQQLRKQSGSWFELVEQQGDLSGVEAAVAAQHRSFLREVEVTPMTRSFKMVLLEAFQELDGWRQAPELVELAERSWIVLQRRRSLLGDLPSSEFSAETGKSPAWLTYWTRNPIKAWSGGNRDVDASSSFRVHESQFSASFAVSPNEVGVLSDLVQEIVDYRLAAYELRQAVPANSNVVPIRIPAALGTEIPYFPNLRIACGHFRTGRADAEEHRFVGEGHGRLDPARHFIARAMGRSMDGGKNPIRDGDYLLLEHISPERAGSITGNTIVAERQDTSGDDQYLLRVVLKQPDGTYILRASNPDYADMPATEEIRTLARLKAILDPLEISVGQAFLREDIPGLFGETFNPGNWNAGHIVLPARKAHVLLVTLNKQGKSVDHRYLDHWIDERTFHWQSQNQTTPDSQRGRELIEHQQREVSIYLFVREHKLQSGKGAPFIYHGKLRYLRHSGSAPMSVEFRVGDD